MDWELDKKRPLCPQICEQLCVMIAKGQFTSGERLMSVRDLAVDAGVTPNTVQKSFEQLEQKGVIYSIRGSGWYVSENTEVAREVLSELIRSKTASYLNDMRSLGMTKDEVLRQIEEVSNE
ncbi:MAG: GntR family transcriptional regulator [Ruminococcus sp.]|nr:GntR family transcriptional regulator [Ruminococcus sp.]